MFRCAQPLQKDGPGKRRAAKVRANPDRIEENRRAGLLVRSKPVPETEMEVPKEG